VERFFLMSSLSKSKSKVYSAVSPGSLGKIEETLQSSSWKAIAGLANMLELASVTTVSKSFLAMASD